MLLTKCERLKFISVMCCEKKAVFDWKPILNEFQRKLKIDCQAFKLLQCTALDTILDQCFGIPSYLLLHIECSGWIL